MTVSVLVGLILLAVYSISSTLLVIARDTPGKDSAMTGKHEKPKDSKTERQLRRALKSKAAEVQPKGTLKDIFKKIEKGKGNKCPPSTSRGIRETGKR